MAEGNGDGKLKECTCKGLNGVHAADCEYLKSKLALDALHPPKLKEVELKMESLFTAEKGISVVAPGDGQFYNMPTCLWLLESAKDFIKEVNFRNSQPKVQHAPVNLLNRLGKFTKGAFGGGK